MAKTLSSRHVPPLWEYYQYPGVWVAGSDYETMARSVQTAGVQGGIKQVSSRKDTTLTIHGAGGSLVFRDGNIFYVPEGSSDQAVCFPLEKGDGPEVVELLEEWLDRGIIKPLEL